MRESYAHRGRAYTAQSRRHLKGLWRNNHVTGFSPFGLGEKRNLTAEAYQGGSIQKTAWRGCSSGALLAKLSGEDSRAQGAGGLRLHRAAQLREAEALPGGLRCDRRPLGKARDAAPIDTSLSQKASGRRQQDLGSLKGIGHSNRSGEKAFRLKGSYTKPFEAGWPSRP